MFKDKQYSATVTHAASDAARQKDSSDMTSDVISALATASYFLVMNCRHSRNGCTRTDTLLCVPSSRA